MPTQAKAYITRQVDRHKPKRAARRRHKRHLANVIIRKALVTHPWLLCASEV
jgi:hypothetical protein